MFEHRCLPLKNDDLFRNPPPLKDNHRACDHNAMLAFPQEKISHYTTELMYNCFVGSVKIKPPNTSFDLPSSHFEIF